MALRKKLCVNTTEFLWSYRTRHDWPVERPLRIYFRHIHSPKVRPVGVFNEVEPRECTREVLYAQGSSENTVDTKVAACCSHDASYIRRLVCYQVFLMSAIELLAVLSLFLRCPPFWWFVSTCSFTSWGTSRRPEVVQLKVPELTTRSQRGLAISPIDNAGSLVIRGCGFCNLNSSL